MLVVMKMIWCLITFMQITVQWMTTIGTADFSDFRPIVGVLNIFDQQNEGTISLDTIDDNVPEFSESFTVSLTSVSGGARLDGILTTTVTILANDDPNGALGIPLQYLYTGVLCTDGNCRVCWW